MRYNYSLFFLIFFSAATVYPQPKEGGRTFFNRRAGANSPWNNALLERLGPRMQYVYHLRLTDYISFEEHKNRQKQRHIASQKVVEQCNKRKDSGYKYGFSGVFIGGALYLASLLLKK